MGSNEPFSKRLLDWYLEQSRDLPWRVGPKQKKKGTKPDPYYVYLSEIMLQQTTVATVKPYFHAFLTRWPTISALADANIDDVMGQWAGLGYYSRARNLHAAANQVVDQFDGAFPSTESQLKLLKGVGDYTAAAIASIAFDQRAVVIDGNVNRVIVRHQNIRTPIVDAKAEIRTQADARTPDQQCGNYAQAMMDLGATICTPKNPQCLLCPVREDCQGLALGDPASLPIKKAKPPKPVRRGIALVFEDTNGSVYLERRPEKGLLGGMLGFPTTDWIDEPDHAGNAKASFDDWGQFASAQRVESQLEFISEVRHTFTHFHLVLQVARVTTSPNPDAKPYPRQDVNDLGLPTLMAKVWKAISNPV